MGDGAMGEPQGASRERGSEQRQSSLLFWLAVLAAGAVMVIGVVFSQRFGSDPQLQDSPLIGQPVASAAVPYLEFEGVLDLDDLRGDIVVVNFWASWCFNCRVEHEALIAAADRFADLGVTFVGVNHQDQKRNAIAFLDELGRSPETIYVEDVGSRLALEFGILGLPETFFVDREGTIVGKVTGPVSPQLIADTIDAIVLGEDIGVVKTGEVENRDS
jgi:cytochrome c biogenesis protein CcmG/thiol:disulfide interchange protein DsbE